MQAAGRAASRGGGSAAGAGGGGTGQQGPPSHTGAEVQAVAGRRGSTGPRGREGAQSHRVGANGGGGRGGGSPSGSPVPTAQGQRGAGSIRRSPTANGGGSNAPLGEVKYWWVVNGNGAVTSESFLTCLAKPPNWNHVNRREATSSWLCSSGWFARQKALVVFHEHI